MFLFIFFSFFLFFFCCTKSVLLVQEYDQNASFPFVYGSVRREHSVLERTMLFALRLKLY
jgi:hypothetical protein